MPDKVDAPQDVQKDYEKQKATVDAAQNKVSDATKELSAVQSTLRDLQVRASEVGQAIAGYDKTLADGLDAAQKALAPKLNNAKAMLKDLTKNVDDIVKGFDDNLGNQKDAVSKAKDAADKAANDATDAGSKAQAAQADLDAEKKRPQTLAAQLQAVKALLDQITKSETQKDYVAVYFLSTEAKSQLDAIGNIPTSDEYATAIKTKEAAVNAAKQDLQSKKADAATAADAYTKSQQKYDGAVQSRRADVLGALKAVHPKAA